MLKKMMLLAVAWGGATSSFASSNEAGKIAFLQIHKQPSSITTSGNRYIVRLDGTIVNNDCGADQWTGYLDTEAGMAQYSAVLSAAIAGKEIRLEGTSATTCLGQNQIIRNVYVVW